MDRKIAWIVILAVMVLPLTMYAKGQTSAGAAPTGNASTDIGEPLKIYATVEEFESETGTRMGTYKEAPMLAAKVAAGELPAVDQRLPQDPLVVTPLESIGKYGGDLKVPSLGPNQGWDAYPIRVQGLLKLAPDMQTVLPNVAKAFSMSEDRRTLTLELRPGMKWSDGHPFTADDVLYWYQDIIMNEELTPARPRSWSPGGEIVRIEKLDDYRIRMQFAAPYPPALLRLAMTDYPFAPKHYLQKYHIRYNDKADQLAREEGHDAWWKAHAYHLPGWNGNIENRMDPELPGVDTWVASDISSSGKIFVRNPYYFKVDIEGNQLPYADRQVVKFFESPEVINLKSIAGEFSYTTFVLYLDNYPLYKENEQTGDYRLELWQNPLGSNLGFGFNYTHKDPVLREIFNDIRFRQAISLSINRDEINQVFFHGRGTPRQATLTPEGMTYEDWMGDYFAQYDPEEANRLLDDMGLKWDSQREVRLRPDGEPLAIIMEYTPAEAAPEKKVLEVVKEYFAAVGVKMAIKEEQRNLYFQRGNANEFDASSFQFGGNGSEFRAYMLGAILQTPQWGMLRMGFPWRTWYNSGGTGGEEPPENIKELYAIVEEWQTTVPGTDEYVRLGKELNKRHTESLYYIGTVGLVPRPVIMKNNLRNTPGEGAIWTVAFNFFAPHLAEQWYLE